MDPGALLSQLPVSQLGFGGIAGAVVGYTAKKVAKLVALLLGSAFLLVQVLAYYQYISVDWGALEQAAGGVWQDASGQTLADRIWLVIGGNLPFGGAFTAGFLIGFRLG